MAVLVIVCTVLCILMTLSTLSLSCDTDDVLAKAKDVLAEVKTSRAEVEALNELAHEQYEAEREILWADRMTAQQFHNEFLERLGDYL